MGQAKLEDREPPSTLAAFAATFTWVNCWMFFPFYTFGTIWYKFGFLYASGWWASLAFLAPKLPMSERARWFFHGIKYWIDGTEIVGDFGKSQGGKPVIMAHHPHGSLAINCVACGPLVMDAAAAAAPIVFRLPLCRQMMELVGAIPADNKTFVRYLKTGKNLALAPGGVDEVCLSDHVKERIFLKNRKGFVKYALQHGYDLMPVYHLGETCMYDAFTPLTHDWIVRLRMWFAQKTGAAICFGVGCRIPLMWYLPQQGRKCVTVVGERLPLPRIGEPSREDVEKYHQLYIDTLLDLYNKNRYRVPGFENRDLHIW